ncbi:MAG: quinol dehydrogenase ferredoxin subunit NapH [Bacteroidetes bacterium]|nr:MAG: quinol dehydrogenase ferredoxin subunit NapH [Bacteroidota bacterium]
MIKNHKILILRRIVQLAIIILFIGSSVYGWKILDGNYSTAEVLGFFNLSDPYSVLQILASGFIPASSVLIGAIIITLFYFVLRGRMFCSWVCPLNFITDSAEWIREKLHIQPLIKNKDVDRNMRYYVLLMGLILSAIFGFAAFDVINPISMLHRAIIFGSLSGLFVVLFIFFFDLFILKHGWCGHICPVGAFYSFVGKWGILKVFHKHDNCTDCMKCKLVCPEVQVLDIIGLKTDNIKMGACTNCGACIDVCKDDALEFKITIK